MTLPYETIFSRTRGRISDPKELSLDENDLLEIYTERLNNVIANPRVRRLFSSLTLDDEIQQLDFTLNNSVDETADMNFVVGILVLGMTIEWLQPQVDSIMHTSVISGKDKEITITTDVKVEDIKQSEDVTIILDCRHFR